MLRNLLIKTTMRDFHTPMIKFIGKRHPNNKHLGINQNDNKTVQTETIEKEKISPNSTSS